MTRDFIRQQTFSYFVTEAQDLLHTLEQGLLTLRADRTTAKVHDLMRAAHTLKGGAASVGLEAMTSVAHILEDVFKALYDPTVAIDAEVETLLFQGYECLRLLLNAELQSGQADEEDLLNRATAVIAQLQTKLGDCLGQNTTIPSSAELGFDVVQSMFEIGVNQRLDELEQALSLPTRDLADRLRSKAETFLGLAESLELPGFGEIAQTTLNALAKSPDRAHEIAQLALADFRQGSQAVLAGDRRQGGQPSSTLRQFTQAIAPPLSSPRATSVDPPLASSLPPSEPILFTTSLPLFPSSPPFPSSIPPSPVSVPPTSSLPSPSAIGLSSEPKPSLLKRLFTEIRPRQLWRSWLSRLTASDPESVPAPPRAPEEDSPGFSGLPNLTLDELAELEVSLSELSQSLSADPSPLEADPLADSFSTPQPFPTPQAFPTPQPSTHQPPPAPDAGLTDPISFSEPPPLEMTNSSLDPELSLEQLFSNFDAAEESVPDSLEESVPPSPVPSSGPEAVEVPLFDLSALSAPPIVPSPSPRPPAPTVRVELPQLERLTHLAGELLINQNQQAVQDDHTHLIVQELLTQLRNHQQTLSQLRDYSERVVRDIETFGLERNLSQTLRSMRSTHRHLSILSAPYASNQFDTLEMDRYDDLQVLAQTALNEGIALEAITESLDQTTKQARHTLEAQQRLLIHVRDDLTAARMQPIGDLLQRFSPVLHQLSNAYGKPVELILTGTEELIDKTVIDKLYDPLLHLIRNAFDHGIERPEVRQQAGKSATGRIEIKAYHQGNRTLIEVNDDGCGINLQRVGQRAIDLGWMTPEQVELASEDQLLRLLFTPGFSTAAALTDLSGRGVGLDVVQAQLAALSGVVTVSFVPGQGSTFLLQIPLSLTIAKLLICQSNGIPYAVPIDDVVQILIPQSHQLRDFSSQHPVLQWQQGEDELSVPIRNLAELVKYHESPSDRAISSSFDPSHPTSLSPLRSGQALAMSAPRLLVLTQTTHGLTAIQIDQVLGEQELVIRPFTQAITPPPYVYGCCVLSSSQLALVLDISALLHYTAERNGTTPPIQPVRPDWLLSAGVSRDRSPAPHILVVDDSLTLRQALSLTLQDAGYQVSQAADGLEALLYLQQHPSVDIIVCDVEMPRLNGFEFLNQCQQDPELAHLPIVILTSRSSEKHRQMALKLGASAYLTKPYTDRDLLSTVTKITQVSRSQPSSLRSSHSSLIDG